MNYQVRKWLRALACWLIRQTDEPEIPHVRFHCKSCGQPAHVMQNPLGWKAPAFECDNSACKMFRIIFSEKDVRTELVHSTNNQFFGNNHAYRLGIL